MQTTSYLQCEMVGEDGTTAMLNISDYKSELTSAQIDTALDKIEALKLFMVNGVPLKEFKSCQKITRTSDAITID
jgi:hypothetical protein